MATALERLKKGRRLFIAVYPEVTLHGLFGKDAFSIHVLKHVQRCE